MVTNEFDYAFPISSRRSEKTRLYFRFWKNLRKNKTEMVEYQYEKETAEKTKTQQISRRPTPGI
jgi:hypothetical protein